MLKHLSIKAKSSNGDPKPGEQESSHVCHSFLGCVVIHFNILSILIGYEWVTICLKLLTKKLVDKGTFTTEPNGQRENDCLHFNLKINKNRTIHLRILNFCFDEFVIKRVPRKLLNSILFLVVISLHLLHWCWLFQMYI